MSSAGDNPHVARSLVWATDLDVLPLDRIVEPRDGYTLVRSPSNPAHYWGNLLLFDDPPQAGDGKRWEALFEREFADEPRVRHRTFAWDRTGGVVGAAQEEFGRRGYDVEHNVGLVATPNEIRAHPREKREVTVRALDLERDDALWGAVVDLQVEGREEGHDEQDYREFAQARMDERRRLLASGRGAWYVALADAAVAASCGVVVTDGRARYQVVDTAAAYRRRGIASRLVVEAARDAANRFGADRFVIVADAGYHALGLYESLGFVQAEHVVGVCRWPRAA